MIYLGEFKAGASVFYAGNFHSDQGTLENPTSPEAQIRNAAGSWSALTAPSQQNSKTGHYGGAVDTTGFAVGEYVIRMAGTVSTAKTTAAEYCFRIVAYDPDNATSLGLSRLDADISSIAASVWAYASRTLTSISSLGADVWSYATRTLTQTLVAVVSAISGTAITQRKSTRWVMAFTGLGSITGYTKLWFAIKTNEDDTDADAILLATASGGLITLNGVSTGLTTGNVTITVNDASAGNITIIVEAAATSQIAPMTRKFYGLKYLDATGKPYLLTVGNFTVSGQVISSIS